MVKIFEIVEVNTRDPTTMQKEEEKMILNKKANMAPLSG